MRAFDHCLQAVIGTWTSSNFMVSLEICTRFIVSFFLVWLILSGGRTGLSSLKNELILDLTDVVATAEVRINGQKSGVRVAPPWTVDITKYAKPGKNRIEILIYNTLANHCLTIPTWYRGSLKSGLAGPAVIRYK